MSSVDFKCPFCGARAQATTGDDKTEPHVLRTRCQCARTFAECDPITFMQRVNAATRKAMPSA